MAPPSLLEWRPQAPHPSWSAPAQAFPPSCLQAERPGGRGCGAARGQEHHGVVPRPLLPRPHHPGEAACMQLGLKCNVHFNMAIPCSGSCVAYAGGVRTRLNLLPACCYPAASPSHLAAAAVWLDALWPCRAGVCRPARLGAGSRASPSAAQPPHCSASCRCPPFISC